MYASLMSWSVYARVVAGAAAVEGVADSGAGGVCGVRLQAVIIASVTAMARGVRRERERLMALIALECRGSSNPGERNARLRWPRLPVVGELFAPDCRECHAQADGRLPRGVITQVFRFAPVMRGAS